VCSEQEKLIVAQVCCSTFAAFVCAVNWTSWRLHKACRGRSSTKGPSTSSCRIWSPAFNTVARTSGHAVSSVSGRSAVYSVVNYRTVWYFFTPVRYVPNVYEYMRSMKYWRPTDDPTTSHLENFKSRYLSDGSSSQSASSLVLVWFFQDGQFNGFHFNLTPDDPWCHGNEIWGKVG